MLTIRWIKRVEKDVIEMSNAKRLQGQHLMSRRKLKEKREEFAWALSKEIA